MDDIVIEETMTYVAREIGPMYKISVDKSLLNNDPEAQATELTLKNLINSGAVDPSIGKNTSSIIRPG